MSQCSRSVKGKNQIIITQISEKEYFLEGQCDWVRFGCQFDESCITSANMQGGPFLVVGDSFLGKGRIVSIQNIACDQDDCIILKVTVS